MKIKILAFGDMHDRSDLLDMAIQKEKPNLILSCGDNDVYNDMPKPFIGVYGNHETILALAITEGKTKFKNVKLLDRAEVVDFKGLKIGGFPGNRAKKEKTWHHYTKALAIKASKKIGKVDIFISHEAPLNIADWNIPHTAHYGCEGIRKIVEKCKPKLVLSGHIHSPQIQKNGRMTAINVGKLALGQYFMIKLDTDGFLIETVEQKQVPINATELLEEIKTDT